MQPDPARIESIFTAALEHPAGAQRAAFIETACGSDPELRARVEELLAAHERADSFMNTAARPVFAGPDSSTAALPSEKPGTVIGRYKLLQPIGEGGFGRVFMAEQTEPVVRKVALKIIKLGMDTRQVIARFEAERQALAMMDHPNIAKVLDAGATPEGRPFFVMELVRGEPITDYCDKNNLSVPDRLELFSAVCNAVQHAHQKGIIHRDIKPTNVLVTMADGKPVPKVIDFGIAKATSARLTEKTLFTEFRHLIGTPAYMSPEQAEASGVDIDTRSDIYSLGVLLYELLTGTTPFDAKRLHSAAYAEIQRIIREEEPPKPSTRLSTLETLPAVAAQRHTEPAKLSKTIRGDLDWIVMKCLEKDRTRRYETANALAQEIERHLNDEPVLAGPPSGAYRIHKFVRRHKVGVLAGSAVAAALILGIFGTSWGLMRAERARLAEAEQARQAEAARQQAEEQRGLAEQNERRAIEEAEKAERELVRATEIKRLITEMLTSVDPEKAKDADTTLLRGLLDDAAARLSGGEITDELIAAELHHVIGWVHLVIGLYSEAEAHLRVALDIRKRLLGDEHLDTLKSMHNLALLYADQSRYDEAEQLYLQTLEIKKRVLGAEHADTMSSVNNLANLYTGQGRYGEAEPLLLKVLEITSGVQGDEHPDTLVAMHNLALLYSSQGRYPEAELLNLQTLKIRKHVLGEKHPDTLRSMNNLATLYMGQGRYSEAEPLLLQTLEIKKRVLGEEHPDTLSSMNNLGVLYMDQRRYTDAEPLFLRTLEIKKRVLGEEHPDTLSSVNALAALYMHQARYCEAERLFLQTLAMRKRVLGDEHPGTLASVSNMMRVLLAQGRDAEAEPYVRESLEKTRLSLGEEHPNTLTLIQRLGSTLQRQGKIADAEAVFAEGLKCCLSAFAEPHPTTAWLLHHRADALRALGRLEEAAAEARRAIEMYKAHPDWSPNEAAHAESVLASILAAQGRHTEAEALKRGQFD